MKRNENKVKRIRKMISYHFPPSVFSPTQFITAIVEGNLQNSEGNWGEKNKMILDERVKL